MKKAELESLVKTYEKNLRDAVKIVAEMASETAKLVQNIQEHTQEAIDRTVKVIMDKYYLLPKAEIDPILSKLPPTSPLYKAPATSSS